MQPTERFGQRLRVLIFVMLLVGLAGLLILAGTISPNPPLNDYPGSDAVVADSSGHVGQSVTLDGTILTTSPPTIEVESDTGESMHVTLRNFDRDATRGDEIVAFGTLEADTVLDVDRAIVRHPWEFTYMYLVSFLGGLWVLGRIIQHWRYNRNQLAFTPRSEDA
jgi:cytochrome c-type biogenesis protein CcmE